MTIDDLIAVRFITENHRGSGTDKAQAGSIHTRIALSLFILFSTIPDPVFFPSRPTTAVTRIRLSAKERQTSFERSHVVTR